MKTGNKKEYHPHHHIHKTLRKHIPHGVHKAKRLVGFKYPKLLLLILSIVASYLLFSQTGISNFISGLDPRDYLSIFIAGVLLSFGFSAPFGIGFFILMEPSNIFLAAAVGSLGSVLGDMLIFTTIKSSFVEEFKQLEKKKAIKKIEQIVEKNKHVLIRHYLLYIFAGIMLATPLPDEIGISMLAGLTTIKPLKLTIRSFILHALFILLVLLF